MDAGRPYRQLKIISTFQEKERFLQKILIMLRKRFQKPLESSGLSIFFQGQQI